MVINKGDYHEKQNEACRIRNSKNAKKKAPVRICPLVQPVEWNNIDSMKGVSGVLYRMLK